ncbi:LacI family DNA-binding transcriptional regulator [Paenibacillus taichungensis]|uniref:LacI family DNA-binding transcriptional regulator n=1 Tax=Paenibacillus taichungensis TaxID=484184 RepID=UPI002870DCD1|nr:LacI family DNA-binding transcriptional regulator [Paenibacillus taichungensis]MDR9745498.1 LacI family DNA-binding transcriptional regulator [Paenibacillus taichungensis]
MNKTISDIAQMAGVAKSTVSRFLNGGSVSDDTREKIERIIKQYNYVPNTFAQSLKAKKTSIIGTVVPRLDSFATSQTLIGIDEELRNNQYQMLIANTSQDMQREIDAIYDFARQKVSGIILLAAEVTDAHLKAVEDIGIPVLLVGQQHEQLHSLVHNDDQAGYEMGKHVVEKGHRKIVYIGVTERDQAVGIHRKQGFKRAINECVGCDVTYYETSFKMSEAIITAEAILKESKPTIIVGATDNIALGVMKIAFSNKIQIPQELSVTGFGGYEITEMIHPTLTTVKYHYFEAGQVAAQHIIRLVKGDPVEQCTILDVEIIPRESVDKI